MTIVFHLTLGAITEKTSRMLLTRARSSRYRSSLTLAKTDDGQVILGGTASIADPCNDESADFFSGCRESGEIQISFWIVDGGGNEISSWSDHYTPPCEED